MNYDCDCKVKYQNALYTVKNLNSQNNGCMCNTTVCGCCVSNKQIEVVTEKQCASNEFKSVCNTSVSFYNTKTNTTQYNQSSCATYTQDFIVNNQVYNNVNNQSCLCRSASNCTCCLTVKPSTVSLPVCKSPATETLANCACASFSNGSAAGCDCSRVVNSSSQYTEFYYKNLTA